jgi:hypothetical protein
MSWIKSTSITEWRQDGPDDNRVRYVFEGYVGLDFSVELSLSPGAEMWTLRGDSVFQTGNDNFKYDVLQVVEALAGLAGQTNISPEVLEV